MKKPLVAIIPRILNSKMLMIKESNILLNYQVPIMKRLITPKSIFMPAPNTRVPKLE
jgi:hypothetical protein